MLRPNSVELQLSALPHNAAIALPADFGVTGPRAQDGLGRFASIAYDGAAGGLDDRCMHLTNYSLNKHNGRHFRIAEEAAAGT